MKRLSSAEYRIHTHYDTSSVGQVSHYSANVIIRNGDLELHDRLKKYGLCFRNTLVECQSCSRLE